MLLYFSSQSYAFRGGTGVPRQCFGAPDRLEQRFDGLGRYEPASPPSVCREERMRGRIDDLGFPRAFEFVSAPTEAKTTR